MAKHLTKTDIEAIINIIRAWPTEKLTWDAVCKASGDVVGKVPTRQSINSHVVIREAFIAKKQGLKVKGPQYPMPSNLLTAAERIARLQSHVDELKVKNSNLKEQFIVWQYNAYKHGLKEHQMNAPLPIIDRERTEE